MAKDSPGGARPTIVIPGRLRGRLDTGFVIAAYVYSVAFPAGELMVAPSGQLFGKCLTGPCPAMPPFITEDPALFGRLQVVNGVISAMLVVAFLLLVARRLVRSTPRCRRQFLPIAVIAVLAAVDHLLAEGLTDRGICDQLVLSPRTVAGHVQHIFTKLAIPDSDHDNRRVHAVLTYLNNLETRSLSRG